MSLVTERLPSVLTSGSLALDPATRVLTGPAGSEALDVAAFVVLRALLRRPGVVVSTQALIEASWPEPDLEPASPELALRRRVRLARDALERVGVSRDRLALRFMAGYAIEPERGVTRVFTPEVAARVDRFIAEMAA